MMDMNEDQLTNLDKKLIDMLDIRMKEIFEVKKYLHHDVKAERKKFGISPTS